MWKGTLKLMEGVLEGGNGDTGEESQTTDYSITICMECRLILHTITPCPPAASQALSSFLSLWSGA